MEQQSLERKEHPKPTIRLEFFRHDERERYSHQGSDRSDDASIRITEAGRAHSQEVGKGKEPHPETAIALGSNKVRSVETALHQMYADTDAITADMPLEKVKETLALPHGKKYLTTKLLDFSIEGSPEYRKITDERAFVTQDYLRFLYEDSDRVAAEHGDTTSTTYSRLAGNIAQLIKKYANVYPRWKKIVEKDPAKYASAKNELQRFLGTHGGVQESFLMKLIHKHEGKEGVEKFLQERKSGVNFDFSEGFTVTMEEGTDVPKMIAQYEDRKWELTPELLEEIIKEDKSEEID